jgi:hypothetical protein
MWSATRSLTLPVGLNCSSLARISAERGSRSRLILTIGVLPVSSVTSSVIS